MKKQVKRLGALLLSLAMALSMLLPMGVSAEGTTIDPDATAEIEIQGLEAGAQVYAYQITKVKLTDENQLEDYQVTYSGFSFEDKNNPTSAELRTVYTASGTSSLESLASVGTIECVNGTVAANATSIKLNLKAGYWIVKVKGSSLEKIYSPMIAGVYYNTSHELVGRTIDANASTGYTELGQDTPLWAKSSTPSITKTITDSGRAAQGADAGTKNSANSGDDVSVNSLVHFRVTAVIPDYRGLQYGDATDNEDGPIVKITDTMSDGLTYIATDSNYPTGSDATQADRLEVKIGDSYETATLLTRNTHYTLQEGQDFAFTVQLYPSILLNDTYAGKTVYVSYAAMVNENALNLVAGVNTAKLSYSNDPSNYANTGEKTSRTYHYTFGIDAAINGSSSDKTTEVAKIGEDDDEDIKGNTTYTDKESKTKYALNGAVFELYKSDTTNWAKGDLVATSEATGTDGRISFNGLDAGAYIMIEKTAPAGYTVNPKEVRVLIEATYNDDGSLKQYQVTLGDKDTYGKPGSSYTHVVNSYNDDGTVKTYTASGTGTTLVENTKTPDLPSTGSIGTYIFTAIGVAVMIGAAGLFIVRRRRDAR